MARPRRRRRRGGGGEPARRRRPRVAAPAASAQRRAAATASAPTPIVSLGPIAVVNGRVNYNDRFVKPNYNANLSELSGRLGAFSSEAPAPGSRRCSPSSTLRGRVEGTATLEINGKVNPLAKPLALDLQGQGARPRAAAAVAVRDQVLGLRHRARQDERRPRLRRPARAAQLTASNKIVLNQLAFGEKVEGSTASLPVKLAVALLADRNGVIDLDLPVSGSINDPQFSLGGVIWKVIGNLIVKAVTAPFALLASAFGGGGARAVAGRVRARHGDARRRARARASTRSPRRSPSGRR